MSGEGGGAVVENVINYSCTFDWSIQALESCQKIVNALVVSGGKVPMKPGGCNRSHIPKALEHPTGLPNLQRSHEPPAPGNKKCY